MDTYAVASIPYQEREISGESRVELNLNGHLGCARTHAASVHQRVFQKTPGCPNDHSPGPPSILEVAILQGCDFLWQELQMPLKTEALKWPIHYPDRIQLYSLPTPNGHKVSIALEELEIPYEPHRVDIGAGDQFLPEYIRLSPNSKIPAIVDPHGPKGQTISLMESGAILIYLAEKSGRLLPKDPIARMVCLQWLFFQVGHIGPMFGQFGHFYKYGRSACDHPYPVERYTKEAKRLLRVVETRLEESPFVGGDTYTIADIAIFPWVDCLDIYYQAKETLGLGDYPRVMAWLDQCKKRPASLRGVAVCN